MDDHPPSKRQRRSKSPSRPISPPEHQSVDLSFVDIIPSSQPEESDHLDVTHEEKSQVVYREAEQVDWTDAVEVGGMGVEEVGEEKSNPNPDEEMVNGLGEDGNNQNGVVISRPAVGIPESSKARLGLVGTGEEQAWDKSKDVPNLGKHPEIKSEDVPPINSEETDLREHVEPLTTDEIRQTEDMKMTEDEIQQRTEIEIPDRSNLDSMIDHTTEVDVDIEMDNETDYDDPWFDAACLTTMLVDQDEDDENETRAVQMKNPQESDTIPNPIKSVISNTVFGFTTGKGKAIVTPSSISLAKAEALFADEDIAMDSNIQSGTPHAIDLDIYQAPSTEMIKAGFGFKTAGGGELAQPSKKARLAAVAMLAAVEARVNEELGNMAGRLPLLVDDRSETKLSPQSKYAATSIEGQPAREETETTLHSESEQVVVPEPRNTTSLFTTGLGDALKGPSETAGVRVAELFGDGDSDTKPEATTIKPPVFLRDRQRSGPVVTTPARPVVVNRSIHDSAARGDATITKTSILPPSTPTRFQPISRHLLATPQRTGLPTASRSTPRSLASVTSTNMSPAPHRRVPGLGLTPRSTPMNKKKPSFSTPFKPGHMVQSMLLKSGQSPASNRVAPPSKPKFSVFDLEKRSGRKNMLSTELHPLFYSAEELEAMDIPADILLIDSKNGRYYMFDCGGVAKGLTEAVAELRALGCSVSEKWVENHWSLILWKLASLVKARPGLLSEKWTYEEGVRQLKYRYEREHHRAHRSAVKRIQEQDSSASLPMILCVASIQTIPAHVDNEGNTIDGGHGLELTDGWYRILAKADAPISRAVTRGRLRVGYKVALMGARIASEKDGTEVLEALDRSQLVISGNSCSLAHWNSRLGFVGRPFIACISSLTAEGGVVPLMDIKVAKIYPVAFVLVQKGQGEPPWTVEEEHRRNDQWQEKYKAEHTRLMSSFERQLQNLQDDLQMIRGAAADLGRSDSDDIPHNLDVDEIFDDFRLQSNKHAFLRKAGPSVVMALLAKAAEMLEEESQRGQMELEMELAAACPPRNTRSFQIIRFVDATSLKHNCSAHLQIWDVLSLGQDMLEEGGRYHVTNLAPAQVRSWSRPSGSECAAYLSTRRDTRWVRVGR